MLLLVDSGAVQVVDAAENRRKAVERGGEHLDKNTPDNVQEALIELAVTYCGFILSASGFEVVSQGSCSCHGISYFRLN